MTRSEKTRLKRLNKNDLLKEAFDLTTKLNVMESTNNKLTVVALEGDDLRSKIERIGSAIVERFDADGIDDIKLPTGRNIITLLWWAVTNAQSLVKLVREIINIIKEPATPDEPTIEEPVVTAG